MKQIQMLKDAAKGLVIGTALFYITPVSYTHLTLPTIA